MSTANQGPERPSRISDILPGTIRKIGPGLIGRLSVIEAKMIEEEKSTSLFEWLEKESQTQSVNDLSKRLGINHHATSALMRFAGIPILSRYEAVSKKWRTDPDFAQRQTQGSRDRYHSGVKEKMADGIRRKYAEDEEYRNAQAERGRNFFMAKWQEPGFSDAVRVRLSAMMQDTSVRQKLSDAQKKNWENPEYRERMSAVGQAVFKRPDVIEKRVAAVRAKWEEDPDYRERVLKALKEAHTDPEIRERSRQALAIAVEKRWSDPEARRAMGEFFKSIRTNPAYIDKFKVPSIQGVRRDIGFNAQSSWEANIARILMYSGRNFYRGEVFSLSVPESYASAIPTSDGITNFVADFIVEDPRGNLVAYEIMAHPYENPSGWAKVELLAEQYPTLPVRLITEPLYYRLEKLYKAKINHDERFCGWEDQYSNLRKDPDKFGE